MHSEMENEIEEAANANAVSAIEIMGGRMVSMAKEITGLKAAEAG
jgi:hypothetical protein